MASGRHREFDRAEALDRAMHVFWDQGYEATGLTVLLDRMGIGRQSLYDTFGSKRALFEEALDLYGKTVLGAMIERLNAPGSPLANISAVLDMIEGNATTRAGVGCFLANSVAEFGCGEPEMTAALLRRVKAVESAFRRALKRAQDAGEMDGAADLRSLARSLTTTIFGCSLMIRVGAGRGYIQDTLRAARMMLANTATSPAG